MPPRVRQHPNKQRFPSTADHLGEAESKQSPEQAGNTGGAVSRYPGRAVSKSRRWREVAGHSGVTSAGRPVSYATKLRLERVTNQVALPNRSFDVPSVEPPLPTAWIAGPVDACQDGFSAGGDGGRGTGRRPTTPLRCVALLVLRVKSETEPYRLSCENRWTPPRRPSTPPAEQRRVPPTPTSAPPDPSRRSKGRPSSPGISPSPTKS
jgi:hypothetical protein